MLGKQTILGESTVRIAQPVEAVFRFIADDFERNYPRWSPEVTELTVLSAGELDHDWLARQTRIDHGHKTVSTFRVASIHRPHQLMFEGVSSEFTCTYELENPHPGRDQTTLTFRFLFPRLELRLRPFRKLIQTSVQEGAERTVRNLKGLIEHGG